MIPQKTSTTIMRIGWGPISSAKDTSHPEPFTSTASAAAVERIIIVSPRLCGTRRRNDDSRQKRRWSAPTGSFSKGKQSVAKWNSPSAEGHVIPGDQLQLLD